MLVKTYLRLQSELWWLGDGGFDAENSTSLFSRVFSNTAVQNHQFFSAQPSSQSNSHIHT